MDFTTMWKTQFSSFNQNLFQTATSVNQPVFFFWYPDAGFRLISFFNSLPHKLIIESFMIDVCC